MRVLICGGRDFTDSFLLFSQMDALPRPTLVIEGGQRKKVNGETVGGADYWAKRWATARGIPCKTYEAKWHDLTATPLMIRTGAGGRRYNAAAGGIRNQLMISDGKPDRVVSFPGGAGTADLIRRAKAAGVEVITITGAPQ